MPKTWPAGILLGGFRCIPAKNDGWIITSEPQSQGYMSETLFAFSNEADLLAFLIREFRPADEPFAGGSGFLGQLAGKSAVPA